MWSLPCWKDIFNRSLFVSVYRVSYTHHIKDDQNTMGKHIRGAGKCDRAASPSVTKCLFVLSKVRIPRPHYTLSLSPSLPPFSLYASHFSLSSRTTYDWYHNLRYQLKEFLQLRVWQAARCQQRQTSGTALLFLTEAHGTPTNLLEYENLCVNLLQVSADSFGKANRVLFN